MSTNVRLLCTRRVIDNEFGLATSSHGLKLHKAYGYMRNGTFAGFSERENNEEYACVLKSSLPALRARPRSFQSLAQGRLFPLLDSPASHLNNSRCAFR